MLGNEIVLLIQIIISVVTPVITYLQLRQHKYDNKYSNFKQDNDKLITRASSIVRQYQEKGIDTDQLLLKNDKWLDERNRLAKQYKKFVTDIDTMLQENSS